MRSAMVAAVGLVVGIAVGALGRGILGESTEVISETPTRSSTEVSAAPSSVRSGAGESPGESTGPNRGIDTPPIRERRALPQDRGEVTDSEEPRRFESLQREVRALRAERRELLGETLRSQSGADTPPRLQASVLGSAFRGALVEEGIGGDVEGVDCSEFPCIVFGRLEGDEEDFEELERSEALAAYQEDVLTLLLWAVSTERDVDDADDESDESHARESALFAIAFYTEADRSELGDRLDRRIRARVREVWNTDRPGAAASDVSP
ncbi:MAG: hypothetical protein AAGE52_13115 [Myxococcota bacterium]